MLDRKKSNGETAIILGRSSEFQGDLKFNGTARVEGRFKGNISGEGTLQIGAEGKIESDIHASHIIVYGEIHGQITGKERIEIKVPGRVFGNIEAPVIIIEAGAAFEGKCLTHQPTHASDPKAAAGALAGRSRTAGAVAVGHEPQ